MASIERRQHGTKPPYWRVVFYVEGRKVAERFGIEEDAEKFKLLVEIHRGWPPGWTPGFGFGERPEDTPQLFRDYAERTISARLRADVGTRHGYKAMLTRHVYPVLGDVPLSRVDRLAVLAVAQRMLDTTDADGKPKKPSAQKSVANVHGLVSSILADAVSDGLIPRNPAKGALKKLPDAKAEDAVSLTLAEFNQIAAEIPAGPYRDLAVLLVGTGLRWSEATALPVAAVDVLDKRQLTVWQAWKRRAGLFELGGPKTNRSRRTLDLSQQLVDLLVPYVAAKHGKDLVFTTTEGHPVRHSNYYNRVWRPAVLRARQCSEHRDPKGQPCNPAKCLGVLGKAPTIHSLRHTHGSWLIDDGVSLPEVQRRLGHESIQTTINIYGHPSGAREAINTAVDSRLASLSF